MGGCSAPLELERRRARMLRSNSPRRLPLPASPMPRIRDVHHSRTALALGQEVWFRSEGSMFSPPPLPVLQLDHSWWSTPPSCTQRCAGIHPSKPSPTTHTKQSRLKQTEEDKDYWKENLTHFAVGMRVVAVVVEVYFSVASMREQRVR